MNINNLQFIITKSKDNYNLNGKELDEELRSNREYLIKLEYNYEQTGFYYYGARYYTPDLSIWLSVDPLSDKYPSMSPYMYCAGNPIIFIDPDGKRIDEWDYDINTKQMVWVSDKGGSERQYVNVINNGEQIGEGSVSGNQVFVYKLRDAVVLTNKDQNFDDQNYNRNNEYEYTTNEFNIRMKLFEKNSPFKRFIQGEESNGKAPPLSYSEEEKLYGYTNMKLRMIGMAISLAFDVMPSPVPSTPTSNFKSSKISSTGAKYSSTSSSNIKGHQGVKALSGSSSWNKFLQANKGVYSGQGWQKRAAEAYYKSSYYRP